MEQSTSMKVMVVIALGEMLVETCTETKSVTATTPNMSSSVYTFCKKRSLVGEPSAQ